MSVEQEQRRALQFLDGLRTVAERMQLESNGESGSSNEQYGSMIRSYFEKADGPDKALLCSMRPFMMALVSQLQLPNEEVNQNEEVAETHDCNKPEVIDRDETDVSSEESAKMPFRSEELDMQASCLDPHYPTPEKIVEIGSSYETNDSSFCEGDSFPVSSSDACPHSSSYREKQFCPRTSPTTICDDAIYTHQDSAREESQIDAQLSMAEDEYSDITKKIQDISLDDVDSQEQPVNYSLKYPEETGTPSNFSPQQSKRNFNVSSSKSKRKVDASEERLFDAYTETDLDNMDQPIDYSRKYHEYVQDDCPRSVHYNDPPPSRPLRETAKLSCSYEDTIKVFCTEGTPLNFSSSSSLTDLREIGLSGLQTPNSCFDDSQEKSPDVSHMFKDETVHTCADIGNRVLSTVEEHEELIKESRASVSVHEPNIIVSAETTLKNEEVSVNETPLMFSRSSSLCSLNSFDQQSIHDDHSSVCDFSHAPSGDISPSELPDSPLCSSPKIYKVEGASDAFPFCESLTSVQSGDENDLSVNGKGVTTSKCAPSDVVNGVISAHCGDHSTPQLPTALKSDFPDFAGNVVRKPAMEMMGSKVLDEANSSELRNLHAHHQQQSFSPVHHRAAANRASLNFSGYESRANENFKHYDEVDETASVSKASELSGKALIAQFISYGIPDEPPGRTVSIKSIPNQVGKSTPAMHNSSHEYLHRLSPPMSPCPSQSIARENYSSPGRSGKREDAKRRSFEIARNPDGNGEPLTANDVLEKCDITPTEKALLEKYIFIGMLGNEEASPTMNQNTRQLSSPQSFSLQSKVPGHMSNTVANRQSCAKSPKVQSEEHAKSHKSSTVIPVSTPTASNTSPKVNQNKRQMASLQGSQSSSLAARHMLSNNVASRQSYAKSPKLQSEERSESYKNTTATPPSTPTTSNEVNVSAADKAMIDELISLGMS